MKKKILIGSICALLITSAIFPVSGLIASVTYNSNNLELNSFNPQLTYNFEKPEIQKVKMSDQTFSRVVLEGCSYLNEIGNPSLLVAPARILLPYGEEYEDIEISTDDPVYLSLDHLIEPCQKCYRIGCDEEYEFISPNSRTYNSGSVYPDKKYDIVSVQHFRGFSILILRLYPVQYIPKNNQLLYYPSIKIDKVITKSISQDQQNKYYENFRGRSKDFKEIEDKIDNPTTIESYPKASSASVYDYVIITSEQLKSYNGQNSFWDLCSQKNADGLKTTIVTVEEIGRDYSGFDLQEKIRNFIIEAYHKWGVDYVLLGGDDEVVPAKILWIGGFCQYLMPMPVDMYYACLDGKGICGLDNDDIYAEVYIGRACVDDIQDVQNFVHKTLAYINSQDNYLKECLWIGEHLGFGGIVEYASAIKNQNIGYCNADGYVTNGLPEGLPDGYNVYRLYDSESYNWTKGTLMNMLDDGYHLLNHLGHANFNKCMKMMNSDVQNLANNKYFFVYSQGCMAGGFDWTEDDCIAEYLTAKTSNGAFAVIMNARFGWGKYNSTDGPSQRFDREFWDALYDDGKNTLGKANQDSKEDNAYRVNEFCMRFCYYELNLFGDPAVPIHGAKEGSRSSFNFKSLTLLKILENLIEFLFRK